MNKPLLHPVTDQIVTSALARLPHALVLSGQNGSGTSELALYIASQALALDDIAKHHYVLQLTPVDKDWGIDAVRRLHEFLKHKTIGTKDLRRVVIIHEAHLLPTEAQNALLKTLEEPPTDTLLLLTTEDIMKLKSTIRSRSQHITLLPLSLEQAVTHFASHDTAAVAASYYMSDGAATLMKALLENKTDTPLVEMINRAKSLLSMSSYERLAMVDGLSKDKEQSKALLDGLRRVVTSGLRSAAAKNNEAQTRKFYTVARRVRDAERQLSLSVNPKLVLTHLFASL